MRISARADALAGILLLIVGLALLGTSGYYLYDRRPRLEEPAAPGKTPNPSSRSFFNLKFEEMSDAERDRLIKADLKELHEQGRRDAMWFRIHLCALLPAGLLSAAIGTWMTTARR